MSYLRGRIGFDSRLIPLIFEFAVPIERQVGEQGCPAEPVIDLDIAELRVPEAAEQPEYEVDDSQKQRDIFHELRQFEWPPQLRLILAQQEVADQHRNEG